MDYEIRIWKDPKKMPVISPKKADGRLSGMALGLISVDVIMKNMSNRKTKSLILDDDVSTLILF